MAAVFCSYAFRDESTEPLLAKRMPSVASVEPCPLPLTWLELHGMQRRPESGWSLLFGHQTRPSTVSWVLWLPSRSSGSPEALQSNDQRHSTCAWSPRTLYLNFKLHFNRIPYESYKSESTFYSCPSAKKSFYPSSYLDAIFLFCYSILYLFEYIQYDFNMFGIFKIKMTFSFIYEEKIKINFLPYTD